MGSQPFITIDNSQQISLAQAFQYLQAAGRLDGFLGDILRQYLLERELLQRADLAIAPLLIEAAIANLRQEHNLMDGERFAAWLASQELDEAELRQRLRRDLRLCSWRRLAIAPLLIEAAIANLRQEHNLMDGDRFAAWLASQELDEAELRQRLRRDLKIQRLKQTLAEAKGQEYFIDRKLALDRVVLSRIEVGDRDLAEELQQQIADGSRFEQLAQDYSIAGDRIFNGMMGLISRGSLPDLVRAAIDVATPGDIVGPLATEQGWALFRIEQILPASLDDSDVLQTIQDELLDQWLLDKLQGLNIEVQVGGNEE